MRRAGEAKEHYLKITNRRQAKMQWEKDKKIDKEKLDRQMIVKSDKTYQGFILHLKTWSVWGKQINFSQKNGTN